MSKDAFKYVRENVKNLVRQTKGQTPECNQNILY